MLENKNMDYEYIETHFGEFLKIEYLDELGISAISLARAINVPVELINNLVDNKVKLDAETDLKLCKYFNVSEGFFLRIQARIDTVMAKHKINVDAIVPFNYSSHTNSHAKA
jgi:addiction module HigA family antidote